MRTTKQTKLAVFTVFFSGQNCEKKKIEVWKTWQIDRLTCNRCRKSGWRLRVGVWLRQTSCCNMMEMRLEEEEKGKIITGRLTFFREVVRSFLFCCLSISSTAHHSCERYCTMNNVSIDIDEKMKRKERESRAKARASSKSNRKWILCIASSHYSISIGQMSRVKNEFWSMSEPKRT